VVKRFYQKLELGRNGDYLYLGRHQLNFSALIPHIGMISLVALVLIGSFFAHDGYFTSYASLQESILQPEEIKVIALSIDKYTPFIKESETEFILDLKDNPRTYSISQGFITQPRIALAASSDSDIDRPDKTSDHDLISKYTVKRGDTISAIADSFGIDINTLRWANHISNLDYLRPGQQLIVPKRKGVWYRIEPGETLSTVVSRFHGDLKATIALNHLGQGDKIYQNQRILIINGRRALPRVASTRAVSYYSRHQPRSRAAYRSGYNRYPYGWCTWYVASRRNIPWSGNAGAWLYNARTMGYPTGHRPSPGAIMVTGESAVGHVAYVEAVYGNMIKVSEMNYRGWGIVSTRTLSAHSSFIWGYIY